MGKFGCIEDETDRHTIDQLLERNQFPSQNAFKSYVKENLPEFAQKYNVKALETVYRQYNQSKITRGTDGRRMGKFSKKQKFHFSALRATAAG